MNISCLLVDDHQSAIDLLTIYIKRIPGLRIIGTETDPRVALQKLDSLEYQPDLVFLDIDMPGFLGSQLAALIKEDVLIVFTTGMENYGAEAFELEAVDYLLKPFSFGRFEECIRKVSERLGLGGKPKSPKLNYFFIPGDGKGERIRIEKADFLYLAARSNYVSVYTASGKEYLTYKSIAAMEEVLTSPEFVRIHKSYLISMDKVEKVSTDTVLLKGNVELPIGPSYKEGLFQLLEN